MTNLVNLTMNEAKSYFNPKPAIDRVERVEQRFLFRYGSMVRQEAKFSIRKRKTASAPGNPPHSHEGSLKRGIVFIVDRDRFNVVIFPTVFRSSRDVPGKLEFGGITHRKSKLRRYQKRPRGRKGPRGGRTVVEVIPAGTHRIQSRPYMDPAKKRIESKLTGIWAYARNIK